MSSLTARVQSLYGIWTVSVICILKKSLFTFTITRNILEKQKHIIIAQRTFWATDRIRPRAVKEGYHTTWIRQETGLKKGKLLCLHKGADLFQSRKAKPELFTVPSCRFYNFLISDWGPSRAKLSVASSPRLYANKRYRLFYICSPLLYCPVHSSSSIQSSASS